MAIILGLVGWIARDNNEKMRELREETQKLRDDNAALRGVIDSRVEKLHDRINGEAKDLADARETLAGFQGIFMTREEHSRYCQQQKQPRE
jgi:hypothetical protein